jgi:hypothetical protein
MLGKKRVLVRWSSRFTAFTMMKPSRLAKYSPKRASRKSFLDDFMVIGELNHHYQRGIMARSIVGIAACCVNDYSWILGEVTATPAILATRDRGTAGHAVKAFSRVGIDHKS